jgi:hypothetical protein
MTMPEPSTNPAYRQSNIDMADRVKIRVDSKNYDDIINEAINSHNEFIKDDIAKGKRVPMTKEVGDNFERGRLENLVLNQVLHNHTNFTEMRLLFSGKPGADDTLENLRIRTLDAIAQKYPQLEDIADDAIDPIFEQKDARTAADNLILESLPGSESKYVKRAMDEEVLLNFRSLQEIIPIVVAEYNLTHIDQRIQEYSDDPRMRTRVKWEALHYVIKRHTNNNELCLAYRGRPHYSVAWDIIYNKTLDKVETSYPALARLVHAHRSVPKRPWTTTQTLLPWTRSDGKTGEFDFLVAHLPTYLLSDLARKTSGGDTSWSAFQVLTREFTNYNKIDKAINGDGYKAKPYETASTDLKIAAMKQIAIQHPRFTKNVEQSLVKLGRELKKTEALQLLKSIEDALPLR